MKKLIVFLFILVLFTACGGRPTPQAEDLVISDPAKNLEATVGSEFKIVINSNPSTGYHWELGDDLDEAIVEFVSKDYQADKPELPGSGGQDVWVFKALKAGEVQITLLYYPPSNGPIDPQQEVTFTVTVK
jgi:inhibitor of cysteine peptidase